MIVLAVLGVIAILIYSLLILTNSRDKDIERVLLIVIAFCIIVVSLNEKL